MGVFVNSGIGGQLVWAAESTYGTAASLTAPQILEFTSESLELKKTIVQGKGIHSGGLHNRAPRRVLTNYAVDGSITCDLPTRYLNGLLKQMFGSGAQAASVLTQTGSTGIYTAFHAPGSLKGQSLTMQKAVASVDGTAANPFTEVGCKFTDWTVSVATGAIATLALTVDGRNELAGSSTNGDSQNPTVPTLGPYVEAADNKVFHFRQATLYTGTKSVASTGIALTTPSVPATTVNVQNTTGSLAAVAITGGTITSVKVNGVQVGTGAGTYSLQPTAFISITYSAAPTWTWTAGYTVLTSPTPLGNVKSAEFKYAFHMDTARYFLGSAGFKAEPIENDWRDITGQFEIEWLNSEAMYQAFSADTPLSLELKFVGDPIGDGSNTSTLDIMVPTLYLEGESPKTSGPAVVVQTVPFTGLDDGINNQIQAIYITEDAS